MACTLVQPCTSWCPSSGWGCSGPGWHLWSRWPGCCRQLSACRGTVHCAVHGGPSTGLVQQQRLPLVLWFCPQWPDLHHRGCFLSPHYSTARPKYPAPRIRLQSCPWVTPLTVHSTRKKVLRQRWQTRSSWQRSFRRRKTLALNVNFFPELLLCCFDSEILWCSFIPFWTHWTGHVELFFIKASPVVFRKLVKSNKRQLGRTLAVLKCCFSVKLIKIISEVVADVRFLTIKQWELFEQVTPRKH